MVVDKIKVNMLGEFSIWVNDKLILNDAAKLTKPWQLFCYLVMHRERFVPSGKLIDVLWEDEKLTDSANVLKNGVYTVRKELCGGESMTDSPIIYSSGGYRLDPAVELDLDVDRFLKLFQEAMAENAGVDKKVEKWSQVIEAYKGDFLPQLDQELWVVPLKLEYRRKYMHSANELCDLLYKKEKYKEMLEVANNAYAIEPMNDKIIMHMFRALDALRMYRVIVTTYSRLIDTYEDFHGKRLSGEITKIYNDASERINKTEQDIITIKTQMMDMERDEKPGKGAYFCSYNQLKNSYFLMKRSAERNEQILVLALFTVLTGKEDNIIEKADLPRAMAEFKIVVMNNLRKSDAVAQYSKNQYAMLLPVKSLDDGRLVRDRILKNFSRADADANIKIDVKMTPI